MNLVENGPSTVCDIVTSSSANLNLNASQTVVAAYLYWAGSGTGDFDIELNGIPISAQRNFAVNFNATRDYFAGFYDVTDIVSNTGNGTYTISELDVSSIIPLYCDTGSNFAGWAITVVYQDNSLPLNQVNIYDGLEGVGGMIGTVDSLSITINGLNVLDNQGAKIGFVAWEGDSSLAVSEQLSINSNPIGNPPLNPINNAFNSTNSFTGETNLYNMDIDVYNIQNNINIGDTSATISLTSGQDYVMINNIITVLNSQLPDATIVVDDVFNLCGTSSVSLEYTVYNTNATAALPANVPILFYADGIVVGQSVTASEIPINGFENGFIDLVIPEDFPTQFQITCVVDANTFGESTVIEINEDNNEDSTNINLLVTPELQILEGSLECDLGFDRAIFNLESIVLNQIEANSNDISFYTSLEDLAIGVNAIINPEDYENATNPQTIYVRVESDPCYFSYALELTVNNCPPTIPQGFSPNNDSKNDWFNIQGLYDVFEDHELLIYNRHGVLIFEGNNEKRWLGRTNRGINNRGSLVPVGTYFYILNLNDPNFEKEQGWVYVNY